MKYTNSDFTKRLSCPLCGAKDYSVLYKTNDAATVGDMAGCDIFLSVPVVKCSGCDFVYALEVFSTQGKQKYWQDYATRCHTNDSTALQKRKKMYLLEYEYIKRFLQKDKDNAILDVGCGEGDFLDLFCKENRCYGVEVGKDSFEKAKQKHTDIYFGDFAKLNINMTFDLIIFRGVIQYIEDIKAYFHKAIKLLNKEGLLYICSTPNVASYAFGLFKEHFSLPVCEIACNGFSADTLQKYLKPYGLVLCAEKYFYEETPYADIQNDIKKIQKALKYKAQNKKIDFMAPAFWGNLMTLVFKKV